MDCSFAASNGRLLAVADGHRVRVFELEHHANSARHLALANAAVRDVTALGWQPLARVQLAVGCAAGIALWRISYGRTNNQLEGASLQCIVAHDAPVASLAWHPAGEWLAAVSASHAALRLCEPADGSTLRLLWMRSGGEGLSLVSAPRCGSLLVISGVASGVRVYETRSWRSRTWARFGAPCTAAAWCGPPYLGGEASRVLLLACGEVLHVLRFALPPHFDGAARVHADYVGSFDTAVLASSCGLNLRGTAPAGAVVDAPDDSSHAVTPSSSLEGVGGGPSVRALAWEPEGERLAVALSPRGAACAAEAVAIVSTSSATSMPALRPLGLLKGHEGTSLVSLCAFTAQKGLGMQLCTLWSDEDFRVSSY